MNRGLLREMAPVPRLLALRHQRREAQRFRDPGHLSTDRGSERPGLSVVMAAFNEEQILRDCLSHLAGLADEIVVVDGSSSDCSAQVAAEFTPRVIVTSNKQMLEINKNIALDAASCEWVLVLDPDERLSRRLREQVAAVVAEDDQSMAGYWMPRRNYILGRWFRTMGMYPGAQLRLVRRGRGRFSEHRHHLPMQVNGPTGYLSGDLIHLSDQTVAAIVAKRTRYANFAAAQMHAEGTPFSARKLVSEPTQAFITQYLLLGGWLEGYRGLTYAALSAYGAMLRHAKLWRLQRSGAPTGLATEAPSSAPIVVPGNAASVESPVADS